MYYFITMKDYVVCKELVWTQKYRSESRDQALISMLKLGFRFSLIRENAKIYDFSRNFALTCLEKKYGREIINYDIIKLLILQALRLENSSSFFCAINCFSYVFSRNFFSRKFIFREISQKGLRNTNKYFRIFSRKFSFAGNPILSRFRCSYNLVF